jgi:non-ribosomal peptide synthetase component F
LQRCTKQRDIVVGAPIAGRNHAETEPLIGFFINTLVLRSDLSRNPRFLDLLAASKQMILDAYAHQHVPFEMLVEELRPERSLSHSPLFQILFVVQNTEGGDAGLGGASLEPVGEGSGIVKLDLELNAQEHDGGLALSWLYKKELFFGDTIQRMASNFEALLRGILERPEQRIQSLPLLTEGEQHQLLQEWSDSGEEPGPGQTLHGLFEAQVGRTPDAEAVVSGAERLSYRELDIRADRVASRLRSLGVGPEVRVGVLLRRSAEMLACLLGVLKAGGGYVPLDPAYPRERLAFLLEDSGAAVLVTDSSLLEAVPGYRGPVVLVDGSAPALPTREKTDAAPEHLAYVIYTSGSTGKPKGVAIEHRAAVAMLRWALRTYGRDELAGVLASTSICFDLSIFELFAPLSRGGKVVLVENALALPTVADAGVTLINTVPSAIAELCRMEALPASVRTVNLAGEPLAGSLAAEVYRRSSAERVWNLYGP